MNIKYYWYGLSERERYTLGGGIVFAIFFLIYVLIYAPLSSKIHNNLQQLDEKQATLTWMESIQNTTVRDAPQAVSNSKLLALLSNELNLNTFKRYQVELQQTGVSEIRLTFTEVPYNLFINWLKKFTKTYAVAINQLNVERTERTGIVKIVVLFKTT